MTSRCLDALGQSGHAVGRAGRHQDDCGRFGKGCKCTCIEQHPFGLCDIDDHQYQHIGRMGRFRGIGCHMAARMAERGKGFGFHVETADMELLFDEVERHGKSHGTQSDKTDIARFAHSLTAPVIAET